MRSSDNRIGFVSSFNPGTGMATVFYPDRNGEVTTELPVFAPFGIMQELKKGEAVLVLHLSNGGTAGIVLGSYSVNGGSAGITVVNGNMILSKRCGRDSQSQSIKRDH